MGRLGSRVWVGTTFQIFALTAGGNVLVGREIVRRGKCPGNMSEGRNVQGEMSYTGCLLDVASQNYSPGHFPLLDNSPPFYMV